MRSSPPVWPRTSWTVIGPPESRRVKAFCAALSHHCSPATLASYQQCVQGREPPPESIVRLESPGGCLETTRLLLRAGIEPMEAERRVPLSATAIDQLSGGRGEILHPRQWYLGFSKVLRQLQAAWCPLSLCWMLHPSAIVTAFDKLACLERWQRVEIPVPFRWDGIDTYQKLRGAIPRQHARIFVKLRYGYSAMGAVALEWRGERVRAITTVETVWSEGRSRLFVTKRPRVIDREFEVAWLIDTLAMEGIVVEEWLSKAKWQGRPFDVRVLCLDGRAAHLVGRASASPFTNLNLDARRVSREEVLAVLGDHWPTAERLVEHASQAFPNAIMLGIDLLVRPGASRFAILEANAFGDYLPNVLYQGRTTYEAEIDTFCKVYGLNRELAS